MPIPTPQADETKKKFMSRCMGDKYMNSKFPDQAQRYAVCMYSHDNPKRTDEINRGQGFEPCPKCPTPGACKKRQACAAA